MQGFYVLVRPYRLVWGWALAMTWILSAPATAQAAEPDKALLRAIAAYWKADEAGKEQALARVEKALKRPGDLAAALPWAWATLGPEDAAQRIPPQPGTHDALPFQSPAGVELSYFLRLPALAKGRLHPLLLLLHGGGEGVAKGSVIYPYLGASAPGEVVVLCPTAPAGPGNAWDVPANHEALLALLQHVTRQLPIDPDRIYVAGLSMGGWGSYTVSARHLDRFAAVAAFSGGFSTVEFEAYRNTPFYICHGSNDSSPCRVGYAREAARLLKTAGVHHQYDEYRGDHSPPQQNREKGIAWLLQTRRDRCPRRITAFKVTALYGSVSFECDRLGWIALDEITGANLSTYALSEIDAPGQVKSTPLEYPNGRVDAQIDKTGALDIRCRNVRSLRVLLLEGLFKAKQNLKITLDGTVQQVAPVEPSLRYALDHVRATGDPGRVVWGEIPLGS